MLRCAKRALGIAALSGTVLASGAAWAGPPGSSDDWLTNAPRVQDGKGVKVGERSTFHPGAAVTVGYDSNVFWTEGEEAQPGGFFLMPTAWLGIGNRRVRDGLLDSPPKKTERMFDYNVSAIAGWRQYLSGNANVRDASKLNVGVKGSFMVAPGRRFSFGLDETFRRIGEPRTFEAARAFNFNRLDHTGRLRFIVRPGGGRLSIEAAYLSQLLYFEASDLPSGDRIVNGATAEVKWRVRDRSALLARYNFRNTFYLSCCAEIGVGRNEDSNHHEIQGGFAGQLGKKFDTEMMAGWGFGTYADDPNGPNFSSFIGRLGIGYYPRANIRILAVGERYFRDSLIGNFFSDSGGYLQYQHEFKWRMFASAGVGAYYRRYEGLPQPGVEVQDIVSYNDGDLVREDFMLSGSVKLEQEIAKFLVLALRYNVGVDVTEHSTTFANGFVDNAGFVKHMVMLMVAVRY